MHLATADRLANCIALCREDAAAEPAAVFTDDKRQPLEQTTPTERAAHNAALNSMSGRSPASGPMLIARLIRHQGQRSYGAVFHAWPIS